MKKLLLSILAASVVCCPLSAQSALLKKLGDKAKNTAEKKLEQKVEKTVPDKLNKTLGLDEQSYGYGSTDECCNAISEELSGIYNRKLEEASNEVYSNITAAPSLLLGNKSAVNTSTLGGALFSLGNQIVGSWPSSQECRKVNSIEAGNPQKAGKQEQNKIINNWNAEQLRKWVSTLRSFDDKDAATALRIAELDAELESMSDAVKKTSSWAMAKSQVITLNGIIIDFAQMPKRILDCPLVTNVWED